MKNKYGVPFHGYALLLNDGREITMDVGVEEDWGNVQHCFTDWNDATKRHERECVGWGGGDVWAEIVDVFDAASGYHLNPLTWANGLVWPYAENYAT